MTDPERYSVVEFCADGTAISLEEKPKQPRGNYAVSKVYIYDNEVLEIARSQSPSTRGELETTGVNRCYLDAGSNSSLHEASVYVQTIEKRQSVKIGCPEEAALRWGFLSLDGFDQLVASCRTVNTPTIWR